MGVLGERLKFKEEKTRDRTAMTSLRRQKMEVKSSWSLKVFTWWAQLISYYLFFCAILSVHLLYMYMWRCDQPVNSELERWLWGKCCFRGKLPQKPGIWNPGSGNTTDLRTSHRRQPCDELVTVYPCDPGNFGSYLLVGMKTGHGCM